jgi:hypothetical protein
MSDPANYDEAKLAELMLYIALKCEKHDLFGSIKLNKILFYSDFYSYARYGKAITGAEYRRLEHGPAPKRLVPVRESLETDRAAFLRSVPTFDGHEQKRLIALREPKLDAFTATEIALVDSVIEELCYVAAKAISLRTHDHPGWRLAEDGETIPYETALLPDVPLHLSPREMEKGLGFAHESV